jgi:hypothetical protein
MTEIKLFAVYLGGRAPRCNIELHDVVFVIGKQIEDTYPRLQEKWFGNLDKIHIDSYMELKYVDGYEIKLKPFSEPIGDLKLFFVNFGAYTEHLFGEVHQCAFYVAKDKAQAIAKARANLCVDMVQTHCDDNLLVEDHLLAEFGQFEVDDLIELDTVDGYGLEFIPLETTLVSQAIPGYRKFSVLEKAAHGKI